jgi:hypothetical protein
MFRGCILLCNVVHPWQISGSSIEMSHENLILFKRLQHYIKLIPENKGTSYLKNAVIWDEETCRSCVNRRFGGTWLLPPANAGFSHADFPTPKMEAIGSSETSVHTSSTRLQIPEDGFRHSNRREDLKSVILEV